MADAALLLSIRGRIRWGWIGKGVLLLALATPSWSAMHGLDHPEATAANTATDSADPALPDNPPPPPANQSKSSSGSFKTALKTVGEDELHFLKAPFSLSALKWNALAISSTGVLIANDESVMYQVSPSWHDTSVNISNAATYGLGAVAGGILATGLITHDEHATSTGIRAAEAGVDSTILFAALKATLARQRPYSGEGEGKFFSGNWKSGSFPSGHATFAWTFASVIAHEYPNWPVRLLMYGAALTVSTTRVTGGVHFPADVFAGSVIGYGVGTYVTHKDRTKLSPHSENRIHKVEDAILEHVAVGAP